MSDPTPQAFPNYTQLPAVLPPAAWAALRAASVAATVGLAILLLLRPSTGLFVLWHVAVPLLPALFLLAPGLWRNLCPLAAANQLPRVAGFSRGLTHTRAIREYSYVIGIAALLGLVSARKLAFNDDGTAAAFLVLGALVLAFLGGLLFKGKSGWCSSVCPLLPVQRLYGQTPFVTIANAHCRPCVGCAKNCYDFNPAVASLADQYDQDRQYVAYRRFFAGVFPGFVLAFYLTPQPPAIGVAQLYLTFAAYMAASLALFATLDTFAKLRSNALVALFAAAAFNIYYWFNAATLVATVRQIAHADPGPAALWGIRLAVLGVTLAWLLRTLALERRFLAHAAATATSPAARLGDGAAAALERQSARQTLQVRLEPGQKKVAVQPGQTLLAIVEQSGLSIESGCRMGICGADPVAVLEGMEHLSPCGADEKATLERLGLAANTRLACCARVSGSVAVSLQAERRASPVAASAQAGGYDPAVRSVVVVGHGIAGVTAAEQVRKLHPDCEISIIGKEQFPLYNRMGITRLIYGRSAMQGLYLLPDSWYDEHRITSWLNTRVEQIDVEGRAVLLATGDRLPYDRLILAMGGSSYVPPITGFGAEGTFVLREAKDAMQIRAYAQERHARDAVIAGGGLLGIEAAYALHKLGLRVTVLERGAWPLQRQVDERCGELLREYLTSLGLHVLIAAETAQLGTANAAVTGVTLKDGRALPCDVFLLCAGIRPNVALALAAGLTVNSGVVVDAQMRTSVPDVFCVGDAAEYRGEIYGLWPASVEQATVAAANAVGQERRYEGTLPSTMLKVVGADLASMGRIVREAGDEVIVYEDTEARRYAKLIVAGGNLAGAIMMGYPAEAALAGKAIRNGLDVRSDLDSLRKGDFRALEREAA